MRHGEIPSSITRAPTFESRIGKAPCPYYCVSVYRSKDTVPNTLPGHSAIAAGTYGLASVLAATTADTYGLDPMARFLAVWCGCGM